MVAKAARPNSDPKICANLKSLGYTGSKRLRLYGEELETTSDPFLDEKEKFVIRVRSKKGPQSERNVRIPLSVVEVARRA